MTQPTSHHTRAIVTASAACKAIKETLSGPLDVAPWLIEGLTLAQTILDGMVRATDRPAPLTRDEIAQTIGNMRTWGGGFVGALADAWSSADSINGAKIEQAFPDIVRRYGPGSAYWTVDASAQAGDGADVLTTRMFTVGDAPGVSLDDFLRVNISRPEVCAWARAADLNESTYEFGPQAVRRVA